MRSNHTPILALDLPIKATAIVGFRGLSGFPPWETAIFLTIDLESYEKAPFFSSPDSTVIGLLVVSQPPPSPLRVIREKVNPLSFLDLS